MNSRTVDSLHTAKRWQSANEAKLRVAGQPRITEKEGAPEGEMAFDAVFEVYPEVKMPDLASLEIDKVTSEVTEAAIDEAKIDLDILQPAFRPLHPCFLEPALRRRRLHRKPERLGPAVVLPDDEPFRVRREPRRHRCQKAPKVMPICSAHSAIGFVTPSCVRKTVALLFLDCSLHVAQRQLPGS